jgi:hypothetical protein
MDDVLGRALMLEASTHREGLQGPISVLRGYMYDTKMWGEKECNVYMQKSDGKLK